MSRDLQLDANASVQLDATGAGTASIGPTSFQEVWKDITVSVNCASNVKEATCRIYAGAAPPPQNFRDGTTWGSTGDSSSNMPSRLPSGQTVFAVWTGGDANTTAFLNITGTREVG